MLLPEIWSACRERFSTQARRLRHRRRGRGGRRKGDAYRDKQQKVLGCFGDLHEISFITGLFLAQVLSRLWMLLLLTQAQALVSLLSIPSSSSPEELACRSMVGILGSCPRQGGGLTVPRISASFETTHAASVRCLPESYRLNTEAQLCRVISPHARGRLD